MDREDIENMVSKMVSDAVNPLRLQITEVRARIIGIDGNGTGHVGALQRQDKKLAELDEGQKHMIDQLSTLTVRSQSWNKKSVWELAKWVLGGIGIFLTGLLSLYIEHKLGWK